MNKAYKIGVGIVSVGLIIYSTLLWNQWNQVNNLSYDNTYSKTIHPSVNPNYDIEETTKTATPTPSQSNFNKTEVSSTPNTTISQETSDIEFPDGSSTTKDIVLQVAKNMGKTIDANNLDEVRRLLDDFNQLGTEDKIRYGVWGEGTLEREQQKKMLGE